MEKPNSISAWILGVSLIFGLSSLGYLLGEAAIAHKQFERSVRVKGLAEREYNADIIIWPIQFTTASNDLADLYDEIERSSFEIKALMIRSGIEEEDVSYTSPSIVDKWAQQYGGEKAEFRYMAMQTVTVYSRQVDMVRGVMGQLSELGKQGIVFAGGYQSQPEYIFTRLNEIKPEMVEEATQNAREVAEKFASDSKSELGKIKSASQGQFSISARDQNNPHIKKVRVVSTIEYYLSD